MTLFLSRLSLNLHGRAVQHDLVDCHALHRRILSAFPCVAAAGTARDDCGVLYRLESQPDRAMLIIQSTTEPDWATLPDQYTLGRGEVKRIDAVIDRIQTDMHLRFRLVANPTRRISSGNVQEAERWHGKRVPITGEAQQLEWLARKGEGGGFALLALPPTALVDVRVMPQAPVHGLRRTTGRMTLDMVRFDGRLSVTDADRFRQTLVDGIGSGKAFGMGLLSVAPG